MKCADKDLLLYAVTDRYWLGERTLHDVVKESLDGGVTFVQLREKHLDQAHFLEEAKDLKMLSINHALFSKMNAEDWKMVENQMREDLNNYYQNI